MNNFTDKIRQMQQLNSCLERTKDFLDLLNKSQTATGDNKTTERINNLHSIKIETDICTGSQSPNYTENIYSDIQFTNEIANILIPLCQKRIKEIEEDLQKTFNN